MAPGARPNLSCYLFERFQLIWKSMEIWKIKRLRFDDFPEKMLISCWNMKTWIQVVADGPSWALPRRLPTQLAGPSASQAQLRRRMPTSSRSWFQFWQGCRHMTAVATLLLGNSRQKLEGFLAIEICRCRWNGFEPSFGIYHCLNLFTWIFQLEGRSFHRWRSFGVPCVMWIWVSPWVHGACSTSRLIKEPGPGSWNLHWPNEKCKPCWAPCAMPSMSGYGRFCWNWWMLEYKLWPRNPKKKVLPRFFQETNLVSIISNINQYITSPSD